MPNLLDKDDELVVCVERNKKRVKIGVAGVAPWEEDYAERWLSVEQVDWLIEQLKQARHGVAIFRLCNS